MVDIQQQSSNLKGSEIASSTNGLGCDVLDCLASIESHDLILSLIQALDKTLDGHWREVPHGVCLLIIKLSGCIEHELS